MNWWILVSAEIEEIMQIHIKRQSFVLYQKYTYEDVCRLLNWEINEVPLNIGGYKYDKKRRHFRYSSIMIKRRILVIQQSMKTILPVAAV